MGDSEISSLQRRRILRGLGAAGGVFAASGIARAQQQVSGNVAQAPESDRINERHDFYGRYQTGVITPRPATGMVASFDVIASDRKELERLFRSLTQRIAFLMAGGKAPTLDPKFPPPDSGILGPVITPDALTVTVSVGHSLFDDRYGLKSLEPIALQRMTGFPNDALVPALCHGDVSLQFCANTMDTNAHALRDILKNLSDLLVLRWKQEGTVPVKPVRHGEPVESARNFLGFRDGSANPDTRDDALMARVVWVGKKSAEPAWALNGTYQAVRIIRNFVERWDRTPLHEQEAIFGRVKDTGAPFDGKVESDVPHYGADPKGAMTRLDAHIRLANPRTAATQRNLVLRRPFNYSNGVTKSGQLEMGLLMILYQANLNDGFIAVQKRLNGEPLEEYIKPIGGGYFFTLPGVRDQHDYLGRALLQAANAST